MTIEILYRTSKQSVIVTISGSKTYIYTGVYNMAVSRNDTRQFVFSFVGKLANASPNSDEEVRGVADIYRTVIG